MMVEFWEKEEWSLYNAEAATEMQICQAETKRLLYRLIAPGLHE
jgi:hypothetical protein